MCEKICCAQCCCVWSAISAVILVRFHKDIIADSKPAAGHIYGAATMYVFIGFISVATLYSGKVFSKSCDSQDSKPLLQRLNDDDDDDDDMVLGEDDRKLSADDVAIL
eukprot:g1462.t1